MGFSYELERTSSHVRVVLSGSLEYSTSEDATAAFAEALTPCPPSSIEADVSGLTFIDPSGVSALLTARNQAHAAGAGFMLTGPRDTVLYTLELLGVLDALAGAGSPQPAADPAPDQAVRGSGGLRHLVDRTSPVPCRCTAPATP